MKAQGLVVSDKKIFENCILKTYFLTPWPTYATNWNGLNNFGRGPPMDHSCEVKSKSNERFQRRCCLKKLLTHGRWTSDNGPSHKLTLSTLCSGELKITNSWQQIGKRQTTGKLYRMYQSDYLVGSTEDVGIILLEPSHSGEARQSPGQLVTMENTKVSHTER